MNFSGADADADEDRTGSSRGSDEEWMVHELIHAKMRHDLVSR